MTYQRILVSVRLESVVGVGLESVVGVRLESVVGVRLESVVMETTQPWQAQWRAPQLGIANMKHEVVKWQSVRGEVVRWQSVRREVVRWQSSTCVVATCQSVRGEVVRWTRVRGDAVQSVKGEIAMPQKEVLSGAWLGGLLTEKDCSVSGAVFSGDDGRGGKREEGRR